MITGAVIYTRISTTGQEEGTSLHTQADAGIAYAKQLGVPVLNIYREVYTGAELYDRPKLSEARADIKAGKCSHLIAYSIDRLSRDPIHVAILAMEAERAGVQLLFVTEPLDNTPEGALIRYVKGYAAQIEREKIRERCIRGKRAVALSGKVHRAGTDLYGYIRQDGKRIIHPLESLIVADIFDRVVRGDSVRAVARYLNRSGVLPPSVGKRVYKDARTPRWGKSSVTRILREPSYKGEAIAWRWQSRKIGGRQLIRLRPQTEHIRLPEGTVPAIVSTETWHKAQPLDGGGANTRNEHRQYLLRGRITCERCGHSMYAESSRGKRWYRCSSRDKAMGYCGARAISADDVEGFVWEMLRAAILKPKILLAGLKTAGSASELASLQTERKGIETALGASLAGLQKLIRRFRSVESAVLIEAIDREVKVAEQEQARLRDQLGELDGRIKAAKGVKLVFPHPSKTAKELDTFTFDEKALALRAWAGRVRAEAPMYWFDVDISRFVVGETATTYSGYSPNSCRLIHTFTKKAA